MFSLRYEAPVAAIETFGAVVAHGEDFAGGDDEVAVLDVAGDARRAQLAVTLGS